MVDQSWYNYVVKQHSKDFGCIRHLITMSKHSQYMSSYLSCVCVIL